MSLQKEITTFSIADIFGSGNYVIPIYQRNYAWKEGQIVQLIHDINDYAKQNQSSKYYIGTLVVYERESEKSGRRYSGRVRKRFRGEKTWS